MESAFPCPLDHRVDPDRERQPAPGMLVCAGHVASHGANLARIPLAYAAAVQELGRRSGSGPKVTGTRTPPLPFDVDVSDTLASVHAVLASWTLLALEEHPDGLHAPASTTPALAGFLATHADWCLAQSWADDLVAEVASEHARLRRVIQPTTRRRVTLGTCPTVLADTSVCGGLLDAVIDLVGDDEQGIELGCEHCGATWPADTWRTLARTLRGEADHWLTYAQLSQVLQVPLTTLKRWQERDAWRSLDVRPRRFHADDAQASLDLRDTPAQRPA